ncbi:uncharacterized protein TNCV_4376931 [Trichonephila clavipes]|nr:uncharacterized protein TNCV_4376931 [Trichonephila clavipes]
MDGGQKPSNRANSKGQLALTVRGERRRRRIAREHRDWSVEDWKRVAWSDESRFRLLNADGRLRIWLQVQETMDPAYQVGTVQGYGGSIMVWGALFAIFGVRTNLPQCNPIRRVAGRSPSSVYNVLLSAPQWSFSARQLYLLQAKVVYWLVE